MDYLVHFRPYRSEITKTSRDLTSPEALCHYFQNYELQMTANGEVLYLNVIEVRL